MHKSRTIFLVNDNVRGILAAYEADRIDAPAPRSFFKTFDKSIGVGDFVLVPTDTRHNMTVVKVAATDVEVELDSEAPTSWIIGKIDLRPFEQTLTNEAEMLNVIKSAEKTKKRKELADAVLADAGDKIKTLAIVSQANGPAKIASGK